MMLPHCQLGPVGDMVEKDRILRAPGTAAQSDVDSVCEQQRAFLCTQRWGGVSMGGDMIRNFFPRISFLSVSSLHDKELLSYCFSPIGTMGYMVWESRETGRDFPEAERQPAVTYS